MRTQSLLPAGLLGSTCRTPAATPVVATKVVRTMPIPIATRLPITLPSLVSVATAAIR